MKAYKKAINDVYFTCKKQYRIEAKYYDNFRAYNDTLAYFHHFVNGVMKVACYAPVHYTDFLNLIEYANKVEEMLSKKIG